MTTKQKLKIYYSILPNLRKFKFVIQATQFLITCEKKVKDIIKSLYQKESH